MENLGRGEGRKGQPHNNRTAKNRDQAPMGFEGMNGVIYKSLQELLIGFAF
jgi:hypothetical protein